MSDFFWFAVLVASSALILFMLAFRVSLLRLKLGVSTGDGDEPALFHAIRAHSNAVEQIPMFALQILALSLMGLSGLWLSILVSVFIVARILHGLGMNYRVFIARRIGAGLTYGLQLGAAIALVLKLLYFGAAF